MDVLCGIQMPRHGYGRWMNILQDPELGLLDTVYEELKNHTFTSQKVNSGETFDYDYASQATGLSSKKPFSDFAVTRFIRKRMNLLEEALLAEHQLRSQSQNQSNSGKRQIARR